MGVLLADALSGIDKQQNDVGVGDGLQGLDDRELLDGLEHLALAAQACRVDELKPLPVLLERHVNRIAGRAGLVERDQTLFTQPGVDEGALADVRPAGHGQPNGGFGCRLHGVGIVVFWKVHQRCFQQTANPLAVRRRDGMRVPDAQLVELPEQWRFGHPLGLVGRQHHTLLLGAQEARDVVVVSRQATPHIHHEDHRVGLRHRLTRLPRHLGHHAGGLFGFEAAGVDHDELAPAQACIAVVPVTRQAGKVGDDRIAALGDAIEQRGLAHVRPPDDGDDRLHQARISSAGKRKAPRPGC